MFLLIDHLVSVTVNSLDVLLHIMLCLRSKLRRLDIGMQYLPDRIQTGTDIFISALRDSQLEYVDKPMRSLKQVTLAGIPAKLCNEVILPWIQSFISRTYMPALRRFNFMLPKDPAADLTGTINAEMLAREDLEIKIL
jgi:hypothetical protein